MNDRMLRLYAEVATLLATEEGQDLVEYAMVVACIAFGSVAGMNALAGGLNQMFNDVSVTLTSSI